MHYYLYVAPYNRDSTASFLGVAIGRIFVYCSSVSDYLDHRYNTTDYCCLCRFVVMIPSTWGFVAVAITLRLVEGVGSAMFVTATYYILPILFPKRISTMMVCLLYQGLR